jgi:hypothetical protein
MNTPLLVLHDPFGAVRDDGTDGPLWSSDCRPAPTLKALCGELLMAGWPLSTMLKLPDEEEPVRFSDLYKKEFGQLPKNFDKFARAAKMAHLTANAADPYGLGLPTKSSERSDYGQTRRIGDD